MPTLQQISSLPTPVIYTAGVVISVGTIAVCSTICSIAERISDGLKEKYRSRNPEYHILEQARIQATQEVMNSSGYSEWLRLRTETAREQYSTGNFRDLSDEEIEKTLDAIFGESPLEAISES